MSALRGEQADQADGRAHEVDADSSCAQVQIGALAIDLRRRGFATDLDQGENPLSVIVENRSSSLSVSVHAAPREDGSWWFWWSRDEAISRISEVEAAAFKIAYVLTLQRDDSQQRRPAAPGTGKQAALRSEVGRPWADQVVRRHRFEAAHPEVTITFTRQGWTWTGKCVVDGREEAVTGHELCDLLDELESLLGKSEPAP
jgi:hypothetical protein